MDSKEVVTIKSKEECMGERKVPPESPVGLEVWRNFGPSQESLGESSCYELTMATLPILDHTNIHPKGQIGCCFSPSRIYPIRSRWLGITRVTLANDQASGSKGTPGGHSNALTHVNHCSSQESEVVLGERIVIILLNYRRIKFVKVP